VVVVFVASSSSSFKKGRPLPMPAVISFVRISFVFDARDEGEIGLTRFHTKKTRKKNKSAHPRHDIRARHDESDNE
jgi:hypothetical protein